MRFFNLFKVASKHKKMIIFYKILFKNGSFLEKIITETNLVQI